MTKLESAARPARAERDGGLEQTPVLRLIALAGELSGAPRHTVALADALGLDETAATGSSTLNGDGSPVQLLARATAGGVGYRLLADPGFLRDDAAFRRAAAYRALVPVLELAKGTRLRGAIDAMLDACLPPPGDSGWSKLDRGVAWIAAALDRDGAAVYADASYGARERACARVRDWVTAAAPREAASSAGGAIDAVVRYGEVAGVAVEGADSRRARLKVYWRLREPVRLDQVGCEVLASPAFPAFLRMVVGDAALPLRALTGSIAFDAASGSLVDAKLDLCCCVRCLDLNARQIMAITEECCAAFGLRLPDLAGAIGGGRASGALIGMGCDRNGGLRLNLYAGPPT